MTIAEYISKLRQNPAFMDNVTSWQVMPARAARYGEFPPELDARIDPHAQPKSRDHQPPPAAGSS